MWENFLSNCLLAIGFCPSDDFWRTLIYIFLFFPIFVHLQMYICYWFILPSIYRNFIWNPWLIHRHCFRGCHSVVSIKLFEIIGADSIQVSGHLIFLLQTVSIFAWKPQFRNIAQGFLCEVLWMNLRSFANIQAVWSEKKEPNIWHTCTCYETVVISALQLEMKLSHVAMWLQWICQCRSKIIWIQIMVCMLILTARIRLRDAEWPNWTRFSWMETTSQW